jgi:hypothetical protein
MDHIVASQSDCETAIPLPGQIGAAAYRTPHGSVTI